MKLVFAQSTKKMKTAVTILSVLATVSVYGKKASVTMAPPPVFWNVFTGEVIKNKVVLKWVVTEYNNKMFYIEHSLNGNDWKTIDSVPTKNSPLTLDDYSYSHANELDGRQYYRIRQVDIDVVNDGYSRVVTLVLRQENRDEARNSSPVSVTPNPATDLVRIVNADGSDKYYVKATIYDLGGKLMMEKKIDGHSNMVSIKELPAGIYLMRAQGDNGTFFTQKIIKQ